MHQQTWVIRKCLREYNITYTGQVGTSGIYNLIDTDEF